MSSSQLSFSRKRRSDYETSDSEDDDYTPVRKIRRCQKETSIKESITNKCKNLWQWISELPLKDYLKEAMYRKSLLNSTDLGEEDVIEVEGAETVEDDEIAIIFDNSESSPPSSPLPSDRQESPDILPGKLIKSKPSEAASSKSKTLHESFNGSDPISSTPFVRDSRQRMDVTSYFPSRKHQNGFGSCSATRPNLGTLKTNQNGYISPITNPGVDVEILLDTKALPEDDIDLEITSEVVRRVRRSPQVLSPKSTLSSKNLQATTNGLNGSDSDDAAGNSHSLFTAHEVVRLQEKAKYRLLLDKVVNESAYHPVVPRNKRQALEIDLTHDEDGPVVDSEHRKEFLHQPVSDFVNAFYKPCVLTSSVAKRNGSQSLAVEDKDVEILKVEPLPTYKRRPQPTSKFFSQSWIEELKSSISSETEKRLQIIAEEERKIERYRMRRDAKLAEENRLRDELMTVMLPRVQVEREDEFPPLTDEMNAAIEKAYAAHPQQVLCCVNKIDITNNDIMTLTNLNWLNDNIINCYLGLIVERSKLDNFPSVHAFNTFFYASLQTRGAQNVMRWTRKVDIFSHDILFVPLHMLNGMHWALGVIDNRSKKISYYDSMLTDDKQSLISLQRYIVAEMKDKKKINIDPDTYSLEVVKNIPPQMNGSDCGMFTLKYAEYISRDAPITFTQAQMPYFRRKIVYELLTSQLL